LSKHPPNNNCPSEIPQEVILSSLCRLDKQKGQIHTYYTCKEKDCYSLSDPSGGTFNKASTAAEVILTNFGTDGCSKDLKTMMSEPSPGIWWLAFQENVAQDVLFPVQIS